MPSYELNREPLVDGSSIRSLLSRLFDNRKTFADPSAGRAPSSPTSIGNAPAAQPSAVSRWLSENNGGFGASQASMPQRLSPETVQRGQTAMMDTQLGAQNALVAASPATPPQLAALEQMESGPMNDGNLPPSITRPQRPQQAQRPSSPSYDNAAMDYLTAPLRSEGDSRNADSRQRALDMIAALRRGGALE